MTMLSAIACSRLRATQDVLNVFFMQGVGARQHDAWDLGLVSSDDFTNADVRYEQSFANIKRSLTRTGARPQEIPIVTGFLARGENTGGSASC